MNKLTMLGTGHGFVYELYNTCFIVNDKFLVDTGGSGKLTNHFSEKIYIISRKRS